MKYIVELSTNNSNQMNLILKLKILSLFIFTFMIFSCMQEPYKKEIYGIWKGEIKGSEIQLKFKRDQTCVLIIKDLLSGTVETLSGNFEIDFSKKPFPLSIRNIPQLNHPLHIIVEFTGDNSIKIAEFAPRWRLRPVSFNMNTSVNLKRF